MEKKYYSRTTNTDCVTDKIQLNIKSQFSRDFCAKR